MNVPKITPVGTIALTVSNDQAVGGTINMGSYRNVSVQLNSIALTTGTLRLQESIDGTTWQDIPSASVNLSASSANKVTTKDVCSPYVRALANITAAAGNYTAFTYQNN